MRDLREYLEELERNKEGKPEQVKEALEVYIGLWQKAMGKGMVSATDDMNSALEKVEQAGGLYRAAEEDTPQG